MGVLLSRFRRTKTSTSDVLEGIQTEIGAIESFQRDTQASQRRVIGYMMAYFSVLYVLAAFLVYYKLFHHPDWQDIISQGKLGLPFLLAPLIFLAVRRSLRWWYHRKIHRNEVKLEDLTKQKKTILDQVMETETYKVAKIILEKYAPEQLVNKAVFTSSKASTSKMPSMGSGTPNPPVSGASLARPAPPNRALTANGTPSLDSSTMELRRRGTNPMVNPGSSTSGQPPSQSQSAPSWGDRSIANGPTAFDDRNRKPFTPISLGSRTNQHVPPGPPLPRPVLPRERGYMDRMVEYLVGDGPANRYALICKQCSSHNGMAMKEEFEYIAYRCCYCYHWNPARKQRPTAPKLQSNSNRGPPSSESSSGDDEPTTTAQRSANSGRTEIGDRPTNVQSGSMSPDTTPSSMIKPNSELVKTSSADQGGSNESLANEGQAEENDESRRACDTGDDKVDEDH